MTHTLVRDDEPAAGLNQSDKNIEGSATEREGDPVHEKPAALQTMHDALVTKAHFGKIVLTM
jgi:hypothetical protein